MEISALANETLLAVFSFLTPEELLQCRAVCHRWASLAQDPTLWRSLAVETEYCNPKLLTAILRFAPCWGRLKVNCETEPAGPLWSTLLSTACAISALDFVLSTADANDAALVISRHASLGRLKVVYLQVVDEPGTPKSLEWKRSLCGLLMQMSHTQGLEDISVCAHEEIMDGAVAEFAKRVGRAPATAPISPSLKCLILRSFDFFGQLLLQWHADTLEDVRAFAPSPNSAQAALLLSRMPRLRKLACPPLDNMHALLQCLSLKTLELSAFPIWDPAPADESRLSEACAYLRLAVGTQLEHFMLSGVPGGGDSFLKLLPCLGGKEGTAVALRSVGLDLANSLDEGEEEVLYQRPLAGVLHRLSLLTLLDLDIMPAPALLQALDGRAVPELTQLLVRQWWLPAEESCEHRFIHSEAVRTLLRNYPRLHIIMKDVQFPDGCGCACCEEGCHAVPDGASCMLFGHEAGARCDVPHRPYYCYDEENKLCVAFRISAD